MAARTPNIRYLTRAVTSFLTHLPRVLQYTQAHAHTHTDTHARTHTLLLLPSDRAHESLCFECSSSPSPRPTLTWLTPPPTSRSRPGSAPEALGLTLHALRMVSLTPRESSRCWVATAFCAPDVDARQQVYGAEGRRQLRSRKDPREPRGRRRRKRRALRPHAAPRASSPRSEDHWVPASIFTPDQLQAE